MMISSSIGNNSKPSLSANIPGEPHGRDFKTAVDTLYNLKTTYEEVEGVLRRSS